MYRWTFLLVGFALIANAEVDRRELNNGNLILEDIPQIPVEFSERFDRYQSTRSASLSGWTADGDAILITTRFGDVRQIHRVDMPGGARHQLTFLNEPVSGVRRLGKSRMYTFLMDEGGSEFDQIYLFDPADGNIRRISDGSSRNLSVLGSDDGGQIVFTSTRRNGANMDLWTTPVDTPEEARLLLEVDNGSWWGATDITPDADQVLVAEYVSINESRTWLVDVATGKRTRVAGGGEVASANLPVAFGPDQRSVYFLSDAGSEFRRLMHRSADGEVSEVTGAINWDISDVTVSFDTSMMAFTANENGFSQLYLLDTSTNEYRPVEGIPTGVMGNMAFSPDGSRLAFSLRTPVSPGDVFTIDVSSMELEQWTFSEVGGLDSSEFVAPELVHFPTFDQDGGESRKIPAFVYRPTGQKPAPVIISIHGGPEGQFRPAFRPDFQFWINELGAAVIAPNVRGSAGYGKSYLKLDNGMLREDSVRDIGALLDWIATQPDLDENRVAVYGGSYGGYMVLASAVHYSDRLRAAVDVVGISSFVTFLENTQDYRRDLRRAEYGDERDPAMRKHLNAISPLNNVEKIAVPLFVVQGENDPRVPVTEAEQIVASLRERDNTVWYMNALNEGHGYARKENRDVYTDAVAWFFRQYLF